MATYQNVTVGYGVDFDIDMFDTPSDDLKYKFSWQNDFYIVGYTLYIQRNDKVDGFSIDCDWETIGDKELYAIIEDTDGDMMACSSVVFAKDGAVMNNVKMERGLFIINDTSDPKNQDDRRWSAEVHGLNICGEYAICYAYDDSILSNVSVSNGELRSYSIDVRDLTVSGLGKVALYDGSGTETLNIKGGFVYAISGSYIKTVTITGGELVVDEGANVDNISVSGKGILITQGDTVFRKAVFGKGGLLVVSEGANSNIMDYEYQAGSRISIASGIYSTVGSTGLNFAEGVIVGYGFNNERLTYRIGNTYYSASKNISRNYVAAYNQAEMTDGQQAYDMIVEDGGSFWADGGTISGLTVNMNYAIFADNAVGNNVVLNSPDLIESDVFCQVGDNSKINGIKLNDKTQLRIFDQVQVSNVTMNDWAYCYTSSQCNGAEINTVTINDTSYMDVDGATSIEHMILNSGVVEISGISQISDVLMNGGAIHSWDTGNKIGGIKQYGGVVAVQGQVDGITVYKGARLAQVGDSTSSGEISNMTLQAGAWLSISNISTINGGFDPSAITVGYDFHSGYQVNNRESYKYIVTFYNKYYIANGYTAKETCISVGNTDVILKSGGTMIGGDIENGCLTVEGYSTMSGKFNLYGETYYQDDDYGFYLASGVHFLTDDTDIEGATFNFVLGQNKQLENYDADTTDLSGLGLNFDENFGDDEEYTVDLALTIDKDLKSGEEYSIYLGTGFKMDHISVYNKNGKYIGQVSYGHNLVADGKTISLAVLNPTGKTYEREWGLYVVSQEADKTVGDIDGNGISDVLMTISQKTHAHYGSTGAWLIQPNNTAKWGDLSTLNTDNRIFGMGSTAVDKKTKDIYIENTATHTIGAWVTNNAGQVSSWKTIGTFDNNTQILGLGDFNGDGVTDLLQRNSNGAVGCYFTSGSKIGWNYFQSLGNEWSLSAVGDFNNDGRDDIVLKHDQGFAGCWLTNTDGTVAWSDLSTLNDDFKIVGAGDFNGDGTDDVLLEKNGYFGVWLVKNGGAYDWMGLGTTSGKLEQIGDFNGDGVDDLRIRTATGDLGALLVKGEDNLEWKYYGSVGNEWSTSLASL